MASQVSSRMSGSRPAARARRAAEPFSRRVTSSDSRSSRKSACGEFLLAGEGEPVGEGGQELAELEGAQVPFEVGADRVGRGHRVSFHRWLACAGGAGAAARAGVPGPWRGGRGNRGGAWRRLVPLPPAAAGWCPVPSSACGCCPPLLAGAAGGLVKMSCSRPVRRCCSARSRSRAAWSRVSWSRSAAMVSLAAASCAAGAARAASCRCWSCSRTRVASARAASAAARAASRSPQATVTAVLLRRSGLRQPGVRRPARGRRHVRVLRHAGGRRPQLPSP